MGSGNGVPGATLEATPVLNPSRSSQSVWCADVGIPPCPRRRVGYSSPVVHTCSGRRSPSGPQFLESRAPA
jgi:hypothetical protein